MWKSSIRCSREKSIYSMFHTINYSTSFKSNIGCQVLPTCYLFSNVSYKWPSTLFYHLEWPEMHHVGSKSVETSRITWRDHQLCKSSQFHLERERETSRSAFRTCKGHARSHIPRCYTKLYTVDYSLTLHMRPDTDDTVHSTVYPESIKRETCVMCSVCVILSFAAGEMMLSYNEQQILCNLLCTVHNVLCIEIYIYIYI